MSKILTSPVEKYPGTVTIPEPMTFPQYLAWKRVTDNLMALHEKEAGETAEGEAAPGLKYWQIGGVDEYTQIAIPGLCAVVEAWNLGGFPADPTAETFPATPRVQIARLVIWLVSEIDGVAYQRDSDPNE